MSENNGQPKPVDGAMTARRTAAEQQRKRVLEDAKRIEKLVYGEMSEGATDGAGYVMTNVPLFVKYNEALSSAIFYKNPKLQVRKREGQGQVAAVRAEIERRKLEYYVNETDLMDNIKLCFAEARTKVDARAAKLSAEQAKELRAKFDAGVVKVNAEVAKATADGTVTAEEAQKVRQTMRDMHPHGGKHSVH